VPAQINWSGCFVFVFFVLALGFYLWVRITKTLDLGPYLAYGIVFLTVEILGSLTTILYGINLLLDPLPPEAYKQERRSSSWGWRRKAGAKGKEEDLEKEVRGCPLFGT
jgi:hypothetical protein